MSKPRRANVFDLDSVYEESRKERNDQLAAQIAAASCEVALSSIRQGIRNTVCNKQIRNYKSFF